MKKYRIELTMACLLLVCFYLLSRQAAVISVNQTERGTQKAASPLILVDAGHGGSDPGMIGVGGLEEKGINLSISLLLRDTLEKSGYSVIMTREEDKGLYDSSAANKKAQDMQRRIAMIRDICRCFPSAFTRTAIMMRACMDRRCFIMKALWKGKNWQRQSRVV